jgi:hypothetical protein
MQAQRVDAAPAAAPLKVIADLANVWRTLVTHHMHAYRPEKHYMRGPGPKCREKHAGDGAPAQR